MARPSQTVKKPEPRSGMGMAAMVALSAHMKVKMLMGGRPGIVAMLMGVKLQTEGGTNS